MSFMKESWSSQLIGLSVGVLKGMRRLQFSSFLQKGMLAFIFYRRGKDKIRSRKRITCKIKYLYTKYRPLEQYSHYRFQYCKDTTSTEKVVFILAYININQCEQ